MATKAELEWQCNTFHMIAEQAKSALNENQFSRAVDVALQSFQFIDGMIQFERKYKQADKINQPTIKLILTTAPIIFRWRILDDVETFLDETRRVERNSEVDWRAKLVESRSLMSVALQLWEQLENNGELSKVDRISRVFILDGWVKLGLITQSVEMLETSYTFCSALNARYRAKCPICGLVCDSSKESLLQSLKCPACSKSSLFVLLGPVFRKAK